MKKNKVVIIILATFLSFALGGGCYYFFCPSKDVYEIAQNDASLLFQKLADYERKVIAEKNINQEIIDKNTEILQNQGIWNGLNFEPDYEKYLDDYRSSEVAYQLRISELLKKVKKEKDLESFREELKKLSEEAKEKINKNVEAFAKLANRIQEEAEKPMPISAAWIGLLFLAITCPIISFYIQEKLQEKFHLTLNCGACITSPKVLNSIFLMIICFPLQFLIFPLINCLFSLKMRTLREIYKHYTYNPLKLIFLALSFICFNCLLGIRCCCNDNSSTGTGDTGGTSSTGV